MKWQFIYGPFIKEDWDTGNVKYPPGQHMFCDGNGNPLKLSEVKSGMRIKLRARNVHFKGWDMLYSTEGRWGKYK